MFNPNSDLVTNLFTQNSDILTPRRSQSVLKLIDRKFGLLFEADSRLSLIQIWPGLSLPGFGAKFGTTPSAQSSKPKLSWTDLLNLIQREAKLSSDEESQALLDSYIKAHVAIMSPQTRLNFVSLCPDEVLRSYLRVIG